MQNNKSLEFQSLAKEENNYLGKLILQKMSVEDYMNDCEDNHPAVYVGTYRKYNEGSLFGMWVDMVKIVANLHECIVIAALYHINPHAEKAAIIVLGVCTNVNGGVIVRGIIHIILNRHLLKDELTETIVLLLSEALKLY